MSGARYHLGPLGSVLLNDLELLGGEFPRLVDDVLRNVKLADVVYGRG
jgi:hypothetical protein